MPGLGPMEIAIFAVLILLLLAGGVTAIVAFVVRGSLRRQQLPPNTAPPGLPPEQTSEPDGYVQHPGFAPGTPPPPPATDRHQQR